MEILGFEFKWSRSVTWIERSSAQERRRKLLLVHCFECAFFVTPNAHPMGSDLVLYKMGQSSKMGDELSACSLELIAVVSSLIVSLDWGSENCLILVFYFKSFWACTLNFARGDGYRQLIAERTSLIPCCPLGRITARVPQFLGRVAKMQERLTRTMTLIGQIGQ
jgi:hypothetical protein